MMDMGLIKPPNKWWSTPARIIFPMYLNEQERDGNKYLWCIPLLNQQMRRFWKFIKSIKSSIKIYILFTRNQLKDTEDLKLNRPINPNSKYRWLLWFWGTWFDENPVIGGQCGAIPVISEPFKVRIGANSRDDYAKSSELKMLRITVYSCK